MSCVSRGDGLESVVTRTACCFPLVHRVPAPVCDHEWYSPRMVSWDHFQEVSSKKYITVCHLWQGRQWRRNVERRALIIVQYQDNKVVSQHAVIVWNKLLYYCHLCLGCMFSPLLYAQYQCQAEESKVTMLK